MKQIFIASIIAIVTAGIFATTPTALACKQQKSTTKTIQLFAFNRADGWGTFSYNASGSTFDFSFTGKAPVINDWYALVIGEDPKNHPETAVIIDYPRSDGNTGEININKSIELNRDLKKATVWLVLGEDLMLLPHYDGYVGWNAYNPDYYLFGDKSINYKDTDKPNR